jgi:hypothetical protein
MLNRIEKVYAVDKYTSFPVNVRRGIRSAYMNLDPIRAARGKIRSKQNGSIRNSVSFH